MKRSYKILISKMYLLNMPVKCYCYKECSVSQRSLTHWLLGTTIMDVPQNGCVSHGRRVVIIPHKHSQYTNQLIGGAV